MKEKSKTVDEQTAYMALAISILDDKIDLSDKAFSILEGKSKEKLNADCLKLLKYFGGNEEVGNVIIKLDNKTAEVLYKFTSMLDLRFEMTLADRMLMTEEEAEEISDAMYKLNELLRKVVR